MSIGLDMFLDLSYSSAMPQLSPAQAIASGVITKLSGPPPLVLEPLEFGVVADILNGFTGALAAAAGISSTAIPTTQQLHGTVSLNDVQIRMLRALLIEFVKIPIGPG